MDFIISMLLTQHKLYKHTSTSNQSRLVLLHQAGAFMLKLPCEKLFHPLQNWRSELFLINLVQLVNFLPVNGASEQKQPECFTNSQRMQRLRKDCTKWKSESRKLKGNICQTFLPYRLQLKIRFLLVSFSVHTD